MLIETKLHAPVARKEWVERQELIDYLAGTRAKLILVDAPAGFGKTTLAAQWRSSAIDGRSFAWVSLDRGDDDPSRLWWHVVSALHLACPGFDSEKLLRALHAQGPDFDGTVLPMLVNELAALAEPVVLMLDDYHLIREHRCHDQMTLLLDHLPSSAQVAIITRADPPLELARMRAAGEMAEIRARELRFDPPQAAALTRTVAGVELTDHDLEDLVVRTEGWPAGLYLAALSLRGHPSPAAFVRQFTGNNRFIVDFLLDDVLSKQPDEVRRFLTRTSILPRFCAPLCDAVTGSADAAAIIELLERENLFLVPLDESREWFRYHHLFAQVLRAQLARTEPAVVPVLHERASAWHRVSGSPDEAIGHALAAGDVGRRHRPDRASLLRLHRLRPDRHRSPLAAPARRRLDRRQPARGPRARRGPRRCPETRIAARRCCRSSRRRVIPARSPTACARSSSRPRCCKGRSDSTGSGRCARPGQRAVGLETDTASPWYALAHSAFGAALYWSGEFERAAAHAEEALLSKAAVSMVRMLAPRHGLAGGRAGRLVRRRSSRTRPATS